MLASAAMQLAAVDAAASLGDPAERQADKGCHSRAGLKARGRERCNSRVAAPSPTTAPVFCLR